MGKYPASARILDCEPIIGRHAVQRLVLIEVQEQLTGRVMEAAHPIHRDVLTVKQGQALRAALEAGYYDYPKKTTPSKLARRIGISPSALDEILRRGGGSALSSPLELSRIRGEMAWEAAP